MILKPFRFLSLAGALSSLSATAAPPVPAVPAETRATPAAGAAETKPDGQPTEEMEAKFVTAMTNVTFNGRWCGIKNGELGPEKPEQYEIVGVVKSGGDRWVINARIKYGSVNLVIPVPVQMKWAGDTPVIIVDKFSMPGAGTYSARVLVYEGTYAGTWTGGDHGGLLNGIIAKTPPKESK
ncbi:MAG: hypothetical protein V4726_18295 [Verrucomicrobiota bacterium]